MYTDWQDPTNPATARNEQIAAMHREHARHLELAGRAPSTRVTRDDRGRLLVRLAAAADAHLHRPGRAELAGAGLADADRDARGVAP